MGCYQSENEIEQVVRGFETCTTDKTAFKHRDHLTVAVWYVEKFGRDGALERMRAGLLRFIEHHGVDPKKYSEPVTVYWIDRVAREVDELGPEVTLVEKCNRVIEAADKTDKDG